MRIMVLGGWGYLGWPTALHFSQDGHNVAVVDNYSKSLLEDEVGGWPLRDPSHLFKRAASWEKITDKKIEHYTLNISEPGFENFVKVWRPDTIIHYAENPSAPYSMQDSTSAINTQTNNIAGTLRLLWAVKKSNPDIHIIKLGTMGEYGTPGIDIQEGWLDVADTGNRKAKLPFPKLPGSFYHASKVADSVNLEMACRLWGLRVTDLNQGVVYGVSTPETDMDESLFTSFHYDAVFGTCLNRFVAQAVVGYPLTVYGSGTQTRGWLNIKDTIQCVDLATMNPAAEGEFRVLNQFTETFSINDLADLVSEVSGVGIYHIPNPRVEEEHHYYHAKNTKLVDLGLKPHLLTCRVIQEMIDYVSLYQARVDTRVLKPTVMWR